MSTSFNISKHRLGEYWEKARAGSNQAIVAILYTAMPADDTLNDFDTVGAITGDTEATFTNYARKFFTGSADALPTSQAVPAPIVDDVNNRVTLDLPDITWTDAGGAANNTLTRLLLAYDPNTTTGDDTTLVPLLSFDLTATTDGNDLIIRFNANGCVRVA